MTDDDHPTARRRRSPRHRLHWARLGGLTGFLTGLAVAVTPVFTHMENLSLRVTLMVLGGVIWAVSVLVVILATPRSAP
jgi:hypothetical protein